MSRVGKLPIAVPQGVEVRVEGNRVSVKGSRGALSTPITGDVTVTLDGGNVWVRPANDSGFARAMWGTVRSNIRNLVKGVTEGFTLRLEAQGVGYRCAVAGNMLTLALGYSHEIKYAIPEGVTIKAEKPTLLVIEGADKRLVGQVAAEIRAFRKPEPYKGKGVRKEGEYVPMKEGKKK